MYTCVCLPVPTSRRSEICENIEEKSGFHSHVFARLEPGKNGNELIPRRLLRFSQHHYRDASILYEFPRLMILTFVAYHFTGDDGDESL